MQRPFRSVKVRCSFPIIDKGSNECPWIRSIERHAPHPLNSSIGPAASPTPVDRPYPSNIFLETTTRCNLKCQMCVRQAAQHRIEEGDLSQITFEAVAPAFDTLDTLILSGIGEPLLHPCYFLWHSFLYYQHEHRKHVTARSFGDLAQQSLREIWNSQDYRAFRREVLRYDFPYCSNCNVGPCDLVYTENFEQDYHTIDVPCGDCPWCMGVLQCMR